MQDTFGKRLKDLRIEKRLGQVALAKALGLSKSIISDWENDKYDPKLTNLILLAKYFEVSIDYLAGLKDY